MKYNFFFLQFYSTIFCVSTRFINNLLKIFTIPINSELWESNTSFLNTKPRYFSTLPPPWEPRTCLDCGAGDILFQQFLNGETPNWFSSRSVKSFTQRTANWGHNAAAPGVSIPENKPSLSFIIIFYPLNRQTTHLSKSYAYAFRFSSLALIV